MPKPGPNHPFKNIDFRKRKKRPKTTAQQAKARDKLVREFIRTHGVTKLPPGFSHVDW